MFDRNIPIKLKVYFAQQFPNLFIEELLLVPRLPVVAGLAVLDTIYIVALFHVSTALTEYHKSAIYVSYFAFFLTFILAAPCTTPSTYSNSILSPLAENREAGPVSLLSCKVVL